MSLEVVLLGLSTVEVLPLFHLYPGGSALRLLSKPLRVLECEYDLEVCGWARGPEAFKGVEIPLDAVKHLTHRWGCDIVFLDGLEPLGFFNAGYLKGYLGEDVILASRAHGFTGPSNHVDYYLVEDLSIIAGDEALRRNVVKLVEDLKSRGKPFELHVYTVNPYIEEVGELADLAGGAGVPLHVTIYHPRGGGPVRSLYEHLRRRAKIVYVHTSIYDEIDTKCPNCGTILLYRARGALRGVNLNDSSCPNCGTPIPIVGRIRGRSRESLLRITRGRVVWFNPLFYKSMLTGKTQPPA